MGQCTSAKLTAEEVEQLKLEKERNKDIDKLIKKDAEVDKKVVKILLLGAGESGKSTLFKQLKIIYQGDFSSSERMSYVPVIVGNLFSGMSAMIKYANAAGLAEEVKDDSGADDAAVSRAKKFILDATKDLRYVPEKISEEDAGLFKLLWKLPEIQMAYKSRAKFQMQDTVKYYLTEIDRIASDGYVPTNLDILNSRRKTTGFSEMEITIDKTKLKVVDVGGQRSERKKWVHQFQHCKALIFVAAVNEFDQVTEEDGTTNRLEESLILFREICDTLENLGVILFLNKVDLLQEKLSAGADPRRFFSDYSGPIDVKSVLKFFSSRFATQLKEGRDVYAHNTLALDTDIMKRVLTDIKDVLLNSLVKDLV